MDCKFCTYCKYYEKGQSICKDDNEAMTYCASRWQFEEHNKGNREFGSNIGNMFIIRVPKNESANRGSYQLVSKLADTTNIPASPAMTKIGES